MYDAAELTKESDLFANVLGLPFDIAACSAKRYLYISERNTGIVRRVGFSVADTEAGIRVQLEGERKQWRVAGSPNGLSVTPESTVLVSCDTDRTLKEYDSDGIHLREVRLPADMDRPHHALRFLPSCNDFLVCHGGWSSTKPRACVVRSTAVGADAASTSSCPAVGLMTGNIKSEKEVYGGSAGSKVGQLNVPLRLAIQNVSALSEDTVNQQRRLFVLDSKSNRVVLLKLSINTTANEYSLDHVGHLVAPRWDGKQFTPDTLCLDESGRQLYVSADSNLSTYYIPADDNNLNELIASNSTELDPG